jgi:hypothetical protein
MEQRRAAECVRSRNAAQQELDLAIARDTAESAVEAELAGVVTRDELKVFIEPNKAMRLEIIERARQNLALWVKLDQQTDDKECADCCDRLRALKFLSDDKVVEVTPERQTLLEEVDALELSDAAKKKLLELRWR